MTMPMGPMIMSASREHTTTAFSPVAAWSAPALSIADVAVVLVPTAIISASGNASRMALTACFPIPPPWASITSIFIRSTLPPSGRSRCFVQF